MEFEDELLDLHGETDPADADALPLLDGDAQELAPDEVPAVEDLPEAAPAAQEPRLDAELMASMDELATLRQTQAQKTAQDDRLLSLFRGMGYQGDLHAVADAIEAQQRDMTAEQVKLEREGREAIAREQSAIEKTREEANALVAQAVFAADLAELRLIDPNVKSLDALGERFFKLRAAGFGNVEAYELFRSEKAAASPAAASGGKAHLTPTGGGTAAAVAKDIPAKDMDFWQDSFPNDTPAQLKARYNRAVKRQEGE